MVRRDAAAPDDFEVTVLANFRVLFDELSKESAPRVSSISVAAAAAERRFRRGLVAALARRHEDDCGEQIVCAESGEQRSGRHLRHVHAPARPRLSPLSEAREGLIAARVGVL